MVNVMLLLHVIGAAGMGFYLVLPFMIGRASKLSGTGQGGLSEGLLVANRMAQYFLILQFLTGGYLISKGDYSVAWMIIIVLLFLGIAAVGGIVTKPLKQIKVSIEQGQSATAHISKARTLSFIVWVMFIAILVLMKYTF
ncbi:hypothetical protein ACFSTH_07440 [Paenibacillus yanchengensis]|uniref:DUF2269 family protein n=1 Tax=Paenibacillus yanchengensis TaxID=2035833 RepID=A0ABW4YLB0_9BACL